MALPRVIEILLKDIAAEWDYPETATAEEQPEVYLTSLLMAILEDLSGSPSRTPQYTILKALYAHVMAEARAALEHSELPQSFLKRVERARKIHGRRGYKMRRR